MILYAASSNPGKLNEFALAARSLSRPDLRIEPLPGLDNISAPEEKGATFEENARTKAAYYSGFTGELVFADDSGLEVDALDGAPGVFSARYAGPQATDDENNRLLLRNIGSSKQRSARFVCTIALAQGQKVLATFRGEVEGEILYGPRGENGFGYDPLFYYAAFGCTFGEVPAERKWEVSHRGAAIRGLLRWVLREKLQTGFD